MVGWYGRFAALIIGFSSGAFGWPVWSGQQAQSTTPAGMRTATDAEAAAALSFDEVQFTPVRTHIWVAEKDFSRVSETPQTIIVPHGVQWLGGTDLRQTVLLLEGREVIEQQKGTPEQKIVDATPLYDYWCYGVLMDVVRPASCDPNVRGAVQEKPMQARLRLYDASKDNVAWQVKQPDGGTGLAVATTDLYVTPLYSATYKIVLAPHTHLVGGALGLNEVTTAARYARPYTRFTSLVDPFCQAIYSYAQNEQYHWPLRDYIGNSVVEAYADCKLPEPPSDNSGVTNPKEPVKPEPVVEPPNPDGDDDEEPAETAPR